MSFDYPSNTPVVKDDGMATEPWQSVFNRWHNIITSCQQAGTTSQRPASMLWIGRRYFDTTLGKPVYVKNVRPSVWVDGVGTVC